ncbi:MAG: ABC transporter permease, partial [Paracoccaceae bacterium]
KTQTIATLKTIGAVGGTIFSVYFIQIALLSVLGIVIGLVLGAGLPLALGPVFAASLPVPAEFGIYARPLAEAALYGTLTALIFTIWPLARARGIRAAALFRDLAAPERRLPPARYVAANAFAVLVLVGLAAWLSGVPALTFWAAGGIFAAMLVLLAAAVLVRRVAAGLSHASFVRGRPATRLALASVGGPGGGAASAILSMGLGLSVLAAIGQIDSNLRGVISQDLPERAPSFFFVDIQKDQLQGFLERTGGEPGVERVDTAPMLRGIITRINGRPAAATAGDHWALRGDRGLTYAAAPPPGTEITAGTWWAADYSGPPVMSFAEEEAREMGLKLGDTVTVNVLGRELTATITSLRTVDFSDMGINFLMILDPAALQAAPHSHIATVYADSAAEGRLLAGLSDTFPNITAISVREAIERIRGMLSSLAAAIRWGASATLLTGFVVLIGTAAASEQRRVFEAAVLKTLGAVRGRILASFALRSALVGAAAGSVAILAGSIAGWAVMTYVMEADYRFEPVSATLIVLGGISVSLCAGLLFALKPLATRPAQVLRARE